MAFKNGGQSQSDDILSEINMTPLVDVMLVLLIIFMLTMPVLTHAVRLDLPQANAAATTERPRTVTLSIAEDGKVYWDQTTIDKASLAQRLTALARSNPQAEILIRGDRRVEYQYVMEIMALAQQSGLSHLSFLAEAGPHKP